MSFMSLWFWTCTYLYIYFQEVIIFHVCDVNKQPVCLYKHLDKLVLDEDNFWIISSVSGQFVIQWSFTYPDLNYPDCSVIQTPVWEHGMKYPYRKLALEQGGSDKWGSTVYIMSYYLNGTNIPITYWISAIYSLLSHPKWPLSWYDPK